MKIIKETDKYILKKGIGQYFNTRYEIWKKPTKYEAEMGYSNCLEFHTSNRIDLLVEAWNRRVDKNDAVTIEILK